MSNCTQIKSKDLTLLTKLDAVKRATAILDCDLANILDITPSYLPHMRKHLKVSPFMIDKIKYLVRALREHQKGRPDPVFKKHYTETNIMYIKRRRRLVSQFKKIFKAALANIN